MKEKQNTDLQAAKEFWSAHLGNITAPTALMIDGVALAVTDNKQPKEKAEWVLGDSLSQTVAAWLAANKLDKQVLWSGLWSILLFRYSAEEQVLFGLSSPEFNPPAIAPISPVYSEGQSVVDFFHQLQSIFQKITELEIPSLE